jgi:hypothetical protein
MAADALVSLPVSVLALLPPMALSLTTIVRISLTCRALRSIKSEFMAFSPGQIVPGGLFTVSGVDCTTGGRSAFT